MREIKFRGKRKHGIEILIGDLQHHWNGEIYIFPIGDDRLNSPDWYEIIPETIGQFTGLKDKNGKEIYEGDIIQWFETDFNDAAMELSVVVFSDSCWCRKVDDIIEPINWGDKECNEEVIGNIHENQELLKQ